MNKETIGKKYPPVEGVVDRHEGMYFALATNDPNPAYLDDLHPGGPMAKPMYVVSKELAGRVLGPALMDREIGANLAMLVHGEQEIEWLAPLRYKTKIKTHAWVEDIVDKSSGQLLIIGAEVNDAKEEKLLAKLKTTFFVRGGGTGKKEEKAPEPAEDRSKKIVEEKVEVLRGQTYIYAEASGDHNPIHVNDAFARQVGLPGIILQGLCTMSFVQQAVVDAVCGGDPSKLKKLFVRFKKPVVPGDVVTTTGWLVSEENGLKTVGLEAANTRGEIVIANAVAEVEG